MLHRRVSAWCLAAAILGASTALAAADCNDLIERFNSAVAARQLSAAKDLEAQIARDALCGGRIIEVRRRRVALQLNLAQGLLGQGASAREVEQLLLDADQPDVLWQAAKAVGDLRASQRRHAEATAAFERALEIIKNPAKTPQAPDQAMIAQIFDRAVQSRLLAANGDDGRPVYVTASKDHRDGSPGGTMSASIRGFQPRVVPLPIQFETASAKLSAVGTNAARELADALLAQKPPHVTIVGFADERGGVAYNQRLSEQRVSTVRQYLIDQGVDAQITVLAKGKGEPLKLPNLSDLTREEIWALNRRVEWRRE
ncbi:MAG: OmpA family protein [Hyphomicrobiales bacterium]|nr:OmpA family protein [Hyphomicrobiales bacterium]